MLIVKLEPGVWLTDGDGDPPRTLVEANAKTFTSMTEAIAALLKAKEYRPFPDAELNVGKKSRKAVSDE